MTAFDYFESLYRNRGVNAQRRYPNEELARFIERRFPDRRSVPYVLDVGCGTGVNLKMMEKEGFKTTGIDFSRRAVDLALDGWCRVMAADMKDIPFEDRSFHAVTDVFSSYCLSQDDFEGRFLPEVLRVLKRGGWFFSYHPSIDSDVYREFGGSVDFGILDKIPQPYAHAGNDYPFRFIADWHYRQILQKVGFTEINIEHISRTYRNGEETFVMLAVDARKPTNA